MKILLTTDGSACSHHAIREALRLFPLRDAAVTLLAVTPPPLVGMDPMVGYGLAGGLTDTMQLQRDVEATHTHLVEARRILQEAGVQVTELEREGDPAGTILETAQQLHPDVIVLGSHGRGAVERLFLGSVSDAVLRRWQGAVLVVRPPATPGA